MLSHLRAQALTWGANEIYVAPILFALLARPRQSGCSQAVTVRRYWWQPKLGNLAGRKLAICPVDISLIFIFSSRVHKHKQLCAYQLIARDPARERQLSGSGSLLARFGPGGVLPQSMLASRATASRAVNG